MMVAGNLSVPSEVLAFLRELLMGLIFQYKSVFCVLRTAL